MSEPRGPQCKQIIGCSLDAGHEGLHHLGEVRERGPVPTGGPAFPTTQEHPNGLTVRDYFAARAMGALAEGYSLTDDQHQRAEDFAEVAKAAYNMADAMLAERAK